MYADIRMEELLEEKKKLSTPQIKDPDKIRRAKAYPIENYIEFKGGFAKCVFHEERTSSMKLYPDNHVHCFGCQKNGDTIDVVQALNHCTFNEAIKIILA